MAVWVHYLLESQSPTLHLATHDVIGQPDFGDNRPVFSERRTRHGYALCGLRIDEDEGEDIYDHDNADSQYGIYLCGNCKLAYVRALAQAAGDA